VRVEVVLVGAPPAVQAAVSDHLRRWPEAEIVRVATLRDVPALGAHPTRSLRVIAQCTEDGEGDGGAPASAGESVSLPAHDPDQAALVLGVRVARLVRGGMARRDLRPRLGPRAVSRREVLGGRWTGGELPSHPVLLRGRCRAPYGCRLCREACPLGAIQWRDGLPDTTTVCHGCGACAAVCPTGALQSPLFCDEEWGGILEGLAASRAARALVVTCPRASVGPLPRGTVVERIPCVGALGVCHLAQIAASSPGRVLAYCPDPEGCESSAAARRLEEDARTVTASLAAGEERFSLVQGPPSCLLSALATMPLHDLPGVAGGPSHRPPAIGGQRRADFLAAVRQAYGPQIPPSPRSQLFTAEASGSCTLCGVCSAVCPEGALHLDGAREALTLSFRGDRCIGCGFCVSRCPEAALRVRPAEDITDVVEDRPTPLATSRVARCRRCGTPLGAVRSLERLAALLADDPVVVQALEYCSPCKMARLAPPETPPR
jgi:ferredoxin